MKIYISGKITGVPDDNKPKFAAAEAALIAQGHEVINPHKVLAFDPIYTWENYMIADIKALVDCDKVVVLDDWQDSRGALVEVELALHLGIPVRTFDTDAAILIESKQIEFTILEKEEA